MLGFCYTDLTLETGGSELASTITLVLQAKVLTKCASLNGYEGNVLLCSCLCQELESYLVASVQYPCSCQVYDVLENFEQLPQNLTS